MDEAVSLVFFSRMYAGSRWRTGILVYVNVIV